MELLYIYISVIAVSLLSVISAIPLLVKKKLSKCTLLLLLSLSVGTLMGAVFIHFIPEVIQTGYTLGAAIYILLGFLAFFVIEKLVHAHHKHNLQEGHSHAYHLAPMNLIADAVHNLIDGMVIAGAYLIDVSLGLAATISVALHEIPQEIADFGILLYAGMSKKKALIFNFLSALSAVVGATIAIVLARAVSSFTEFIIPFTIGGFIYIAAANLVPEMHRAQGFKATLLQVLFAIAGVGLMVLLVFYGPGHTH